MNHLEFATHESIQLAPTPAERFFGDVEAILGHSLDGDEERDGYSIDGALEAYRRGLSPEEYVAIIRFTEVI